MGQNLLVFLEVGRHMLVLVEQETPSDIPEFEPPSELNLTLQTCCVNKGVGRGQTSHDQS